MRKSDETAPLKKRRVTRGTFFDGADSQSTTHLVTPMEMEYSLKDYSLNIHRAHIQLGINIKTALYSCIEFFIESTTEYEKRCCILSKETHCLIIAKMKNKDVIKINPAHISAVDELVILIQHTFWLAMILPPNERHAVVVNLISQINFGKPAEGTPPDYSLQTFITDCNAVLNQNLVFIEYLKAYNKTLTYYEKLTFNIDKISEELLKTNPVSNFYFIKHYSLLLGAIANEELRQEALLHLFENYTQENQRERIYCL